MDQLTLTAASGMRSRIESLEMLANNLSNAATSGYKADREFYGLYMSANAASSAGGESAASRMPEVERNWIDFSQGLLKETNNPLDLALEGKGFFVADSPTGPLYT
ncbi:MAG: flagellar hook-basal body complex protein, partial [Bryobacteraceae bacterium]